MNITKAFCLSIALFGASNMQAITNSDFVIQQDNTKINNYQTNRPEASKRLFVSQAVEQQIAHIKQLLTNVRLAWMFENCFPNTLDTTVHFDGKDDTFVYTGDIHAMWLRDSGAQVWPYVQLANKDAKLKKMLAGVIKRQFKCINIDPYANAFNMNSEGGEWMSDLTDMKPELHERKWEIDSLCYPIRLAYHYWKTTGDASIFSDEWLTAIAKVLKTFKEQQRKEDPKGPYRFQRKTERALDTMTNDGWGNPVKPVGLIASAFRPSDDATTFQFLVPSNFFAVTSLRKAAEILNTVNKKPDLAKECTTLSNEVEAALKKYAVYNHPKYGKIYAFEVDGFGNQLLMDDANVPSLLAMEYLGYEGDREVMENTRRFILSEGNPYYFKGKAAAGIGSPHVPPYYIWHIGLAIQGLTEASREEKLRLLQLMRDTDGGKGMMHEGFHVDDPSKYTREWFSWANAVFCELVLDYCQIRVKK